MRELVADIRSWRVAAAEAERGSEPESEQPPERESAGIADGQPVLRLRFLSANTSVRPGQRVFTTGHGGVFQPDILVGTIDSVDKGALASEALIRPAVDFADLGAVFVVLTEES